MSRLIILVLAISAFAFFALQNQTTTSFSITGFDVNAPLALVVSVAAIIGASVGLIMVVPTLLDNKRKKIDPMEEVHSAIDRLNQKIVNLEDENSRLRDNHPNENSERYIAEEGTEENHNRKPSLIERLTH